jgi:photosystem II stability/assembly factor-like uncharacterized protein
MIVGEDPAFPCANGIRASIDSGADWFQPSEDSGVDVAASPDGKLWIVADYFCGDLLFTNSAGSLSGTRLNISSTLVALSADGSKLFAAGPIAGIFASTDLGVSWQPLLENVAITSLACSADGATLVAASPSNAVYTSTDSGTTWSTNMVDPQWPGPWNCVACSIDGSRLFAASDDGVFLSTNAGGDWKQIHAADSFHSIAVSADGAQIAAAVKAGLIYTSINGGLNWKLSGLGDLSALGNTNDLITLVAMSADGSRVFAAPQGGNVYTNLSSPPLFLEMIPSGTNLAFSWPFPSVNFSLEQTVNPLTNLWLDVPVRAIPSYTTLRNLASIPAPTQPTFFRLASYQSLPSGFFDLDFESATISLFGTPTNIFLGSAFPGWTAYIGSTRPFSALFNSVSPDSGAIGLQTNSSGLFDGKYYASIQSGFAPGTRAPHPVVISYLTQMGFVPTNAQSLLFKASGSRYIVSLNGQSLSPTPLGGNLYGANVSRFGGTNAELRFTVLTNLPPQPPINTLFLDSISFSTRVIP